MFFPHFLPLSHSPLHCPHFLPPSHCPLKCPHFHPPSHGPLQCSHFFSPLTLSPSLPPLFFPPHMGLFNAPTFVPLTRASSVPPISSPPHMGLFTFFPTRTGSLFEQFTDPFNATSLRNISSIFVTVSFFGFGQIITVNGSIVKSTSFSWCYPRSFPATKIVQHSTERIFLRRRRW